MDNNFIRKKNGLPRGIGWGIFGLVVVFVVGSIFFGGAKKNAAEKAAGGIEELRAGAEDLRNLDAESARERFSRIMEGLGGFGTPTKIFGSLFDAGEFLSALQEAALQGIALSQEIEFLKANSLRLFLGAENGGPVLLERLKTIHAALKSIEEAGKKFASAASDFGEAASFAGEFYLPLQLDVARLNDFLSALIPKLETDGLKILVLLQNPAELRPAGGFLGSYAVVTIENGALRSLEVRDINDVDRVFEKLIIPPRPLQAVARSWRPYDANWFFDFPSSAQKVAEFFGESNLYSRGEAEFESVIAVSPKVVQDTLGLVGPIEIPERKLTLGAENFLTETQRIVQEGQFSRATYPKAILDEFAPFLLARLKELGDSQKNEFWALVAKWIENKDLMFYFREPKLQNFAKYYGAAGEVYEFPSGWNGDYLAIVDANIDGGKSDLFIRQNILLESQINLDGTVSNHLVINRVHEGGKSKYWWYREENQNYLQVFVPLSARLTNFNGGVDKKIIPKTDYTKGGYMKDELASKIESSEEVIFNYPAVRTHKAFGKNVFSTWSATKSGAKTQISFDYINRLVIPPADGAEYQFVFEKQAGTDRNYKFQISAPVGFRFRENGLPIYSYESNNPPGRLILGLTLERI